MQNFLMLNQVIHKVTTWLYMVKEQGNDRQSVLFISTGTSVLANAILGANQKCFLLLTAFGQERIYSSPFKSELFAVTNGIQSGAHIL
jgi:hypothetical protein